jgi:sporulation protein YlmC with PRC-barrel domain
VLIRKISDKLKGKEVIEEKGDKIGEISDVEWNLQMNMVNLLMLKELEPKLEWEKVIAFEDMTKSEKNSLK